MRKILALASVLFVIAVFTRPAHVTAESHIASDIQDRFHFDSTIKSKVYINGARPLSKIFDPRAESAETTDIIGRDRPKTNWDADFQNTLRHPYFSFDAIVSVSTHVDVPESVGLKAELLLPVSKLFSDRDFIKFGLLHHSAHNLVDERYGRGIDTNALVGKIRLYQSQEHELWFENYWHGLKNGDFANFITEKAAIPKTVLGRNNPHYLLWQSGLRLDWQKEWFDWRIAVRGRSSDFDDLDALQLKTELMMPVSQFTKENEFANRFSLGLFGEYDRNLNYHDRFGKDQYVAGFQIKFWLSKPALKRKAGSDLF